MIAGTADSCSRRLCYAALGIRSVVMAPVKIELPADILLAVGLSREQFVKEAKFLLALKLFELGRISSGKAAEMCEMNRVNFLLSMGRLGIAVADLDEEELEREFRDVPVA
jgi:predicted HTH domain antitoxin